MNEQKKALQNLLKDQYDAYHQLFVGWHDDQRSKAEFFTDVQTSLSLTDEVVQELNELHGLPQQLYPETRIVLEKLQQNGYRLGVVSNSPPTSKERFARFDIQKYFDVVVWSFECGVRKPDPKIFQKALDQLGLDPSEVLFIGGTYDKDVLAPRELGMQAFHLDRSAQPSSEGVITSLEQIFEHIT